MTIAATIAAQQVSITVLSDYRIISNNDKVAGQPKTTPLATAKLLSSEPQQKVHAEKDMQSTKDAQSNKVATQAIFAGNKYSGSERQVVGPVVQNPIEGSVLKDTMANHIYMDNFMSAKNNRKEEAGAVPDQNGADKCPQQVVGVVFEDKATPVPFVGEWKDNTMEGPGEQILGFTF